MATQQQQGGIQLAPQDFRQLAELYDHDQIFQDLMLDLVKEPQPDSSAQQAGSCSQAELESFLDSVLPGAAEQHDTLLFHLDSTDTAMMEQAVPPSSAGITQHLLSPVCSQPCTSLLPVDQTQQQQQQYSPQLAPLLYGPTQGVQRCLGSRAYSAACAPDSPALSGALNNSAGQQPYNSSSQPWAAVASALQLPHSAAPWEQPMPWSCTVQQLAAAPGSMAGSPHNSREPKRRHSASSSSEDEAQGGSDTDDSLDEDYDPCAGSKATKQQRPGKQPRLSRAPQQQQQKPSTLQPKKASGPKKRRVPTNRFRGATLHSGNGQWEAHIWDKQACRSPTKKTRRETGRQVFLGTFATEEDAARAYDRAALCLRGETATTNFPPEQYASEVQQLVAAAASAHDAGGLVETIKSSRAKQQAYEQQEGHHPGVLPHQALPGLWEARCVTSSSSYEYLGAFNTEEQAAAAVQGHTQL